jgi:SAM-dependent methyltransferase
MTNWEIFFNEKIEEIAKEKQVLDVGGGFKMQKGLEQYKKLFANCDYKVIDINECYNPDIVGDIQNLENISDNSIDAIICKAVLEHVERPIDAANEMHRVLKPGGKCLVYVPFLYSYHAHEGVYKDFYRYTLDGIKYLFRNFSEIEISPVRGRFETIVYLLPVKRIRKILSPVGRFLDNFRKTEKQSSGYNIYLIK